MQAQQGPVLYSFNNYNLWYDLFGYYFILSYFYSLKNIHNKDKQSRFGACSTRNIEAIPSEMMQNSVAAMSSYSQFVSGLFLFLFSLTFYDITNSMNINFEIKEGDLINRYDLGWHSTISENFVSQPFFLTQSTQFSQV